jgi:hypothetical protein
MNSVQLRTRVICRLVRQHRGRCFGALHVPIATMAEKSDVVNHSLDVWRGKLCPDLCPDFCLTANPNDLWCVSPWNPLGFGWLEKRRLVFGTGIRRFESCRPSQRICFATKALGKCVAPAKLS